MTDITEQLRNRAFRNSLFGKAADEIDSLRRALEHFVAEEDPATWLNGRGEAQMKAYGELSDDSLAYFRKLYLSDCLPITATTPPPLEANKVGDQEASVPSAPVPPARDNPSSR